MDLDGKNQRRLLAGVGSSILLDFHFKEERIYWVDKHSGVIYKASVRGEPRQVIIELLHHFSELSWSKLIPLLWKQINKAQILVHISLALHFYSGVSVIYRILYFQKLYSSDKHISGLAVDWIWNSVYWTSAEKGIIKRMDINGKNERTLLRHLTQPSSIVVDPTNR